MKNAGKNDWYDEQEEDDVDLDQIVEGLAAEERSRVLRVGILAAVILGAAGLSFWWMVENTEDLFRPNISAEEGEYEVWLDTNDPVCRGILDDISEATEDWAEREAFVADEIWGDDEENLVQVRETATAFRSRMAQIATRIDDAVLRDSEAPEQMKEWFGNQDNEFRILQEMAERRLNLVREQEVEERGGMWENPENLRDTVLLTVDDNYQEFRVWVAAGGHPCGPAPEGVEPAAPPEMPE